MFFRTPQMLLESAKYPSLRVAVLAFTNLPITFDFLQGEMSYNQALVHSAVHLGRGHVRSCLVLVLSLILPFDAKLASLLILAALHSVAAGRGDSAVLEESDGELMDGEHDGDSSPRQCNEAHGTRRPLLRQRSLMKRASSGLHDAIVQLMRP